MKKIYTLTLLLAIVILKAQVVYTGKPMYNIDVKRAGVYLASIKIELFPNIAYHHTRNFDSLVSVHFFDTTAFHRVVPGFVIQGGDPNSRHGAISTWGMGQPGQPNVNAEFSAAKHVRGTLSAARSNNINSATSQFFICVAPAPNLNNLYSIYGRVISGMNYVDTIVLAPRNANDVPNLKHEMFITAIGSNDTIPKAPSLNYPADSTTAIDINASLLLKWNAVKDGIIYTLEVSDDTSFVNILKTLETGNLSTYMSSGLVSDSRYFWRVRTNNGGHFSPWSKIWTFDTYEAITDVGISKNTLKNNVSVFPNPSTGKFTLSNVGKGNKVQVYDIAGKLIYETITKENTVNLDLENKEKGVYSYKIVSDTGKTQQGKLIVK